MPSAAHKQWSLQKAKLTPDTQKMLGKNKKDLGRKLDDYDKVSTALGRELATGERTKKAATAMDATRKAADAITKAIDAYLELLRKYRMQHLEALPGKESQICGDVELHLRNLDAAVVKDLKIHTTTYGDLAQGVKDVTIAMTFGKNVSAAIDSMEFGSNRAFEVFAKQPVFTLAPTGVPAAGQALSFAPDAELAKYQQEFARLLTSARRSLTVVQAANRRTFPTQKDAYLAISKPVEELLKYTDPVSGLISKVTEWGAAINGKSRGMNYPASKEGKAALQVTKTIADVWNRDEVRGNEIDDAVTRAFQGRTRL